MKRMIYLCLLLVVPLFLQADHGRDRINGKWISPYFGTKIKIKVKRHQIRVKGLSRRGWTHFSPVRRGVFKDCQGNRLVFNNIHELVYHNRFRGERIRFVKKGHNCPGHSCATSCSFGDDYFTYPDYYDDYGNDGYGYDGWGYDDSWDYDNSWRNGGGRRHGDPRNSNQGFGGQYHVREIDEYVTINRTRNGIRAKRGNGNWVSYRQNRYRKNEYVDNKGNKYLMRSDGSLTWKSRDGKVSLNLEK